MSFRKFIVLAAAVAAAAMLPAGGATAGYLTGWDLLQICKSSPASALYRQQVAQCMGYVIGISDTFDCSEKLHGFNWSSSTPAAQADVVKSAVTWLSTHPNLLSYKSDGLVAAALAETYPCRLASK